MWPQAEAMGMEQEAELTGIREELTEAGGEI